MKRVLVFVLLLIIIPLCACLGQKSGSESAVAQPQIPLSADGAGLPGEGAYKSITAKEARDIMDGTKSFIVLDVRSEEEYREAHIEGALLIPGSELEHRADAELYDKDAVILVYCRSGVRSAAASRLLADMGYTQVYDFGGILNWPYETIGG